MDSQRLLRNGGYVNYEEEISPELEVYDTYGKTPPRTRILRKSKEKRQRDKDTVGGISSFMKTCPKMQRNKKMISRRNTVSVMFDELIAKAENPDVDLGKRSDKRSMKLLRGSERDLKLDIASAQSFATSDTAAAKEIDDVPPMTPQPSVQIEGCKQFKSLCSRRIPCSRRQVRSVSGNFATVDLLEAAECPPSRVEFHKMFGMLIRMGCGEKQIPERGTRRNLSREEHLWQNELKDLIWLELQAWHADRSVTDEDNYLCMARDSVGSLLNEIMMYRFRRHRKRLSAQSSDSGVMLDECGGCLSMFCQSCMEAQIEALRDIEELMSRLETAESLFPSSKAFAEIYPLYSSTEFVGRVKAMCLWYNMTKHQRLKLAILGRLLAFLGNKDYQWPLSANYDGCSVDSSSPSDSNSSNSSNDYLTDRTPFDHYVNPIPFLVSSKHESKTSPYRKYIENILKTKGLSKSMNFLDKLHEHILRKVQITLEKPKDDSIFTKIPNDCQEEELRRYGTWSPEAQSLGLPSYKAVFLFLASIPLEVTREFILMRVEQKPKNPSPLSVRQLMRELKEGLKIATKQRERIIMYFHTALKDSGEVKEMYVHNIDVFDESLLQLFSDYLEYLGQWALLQHDSFQKNLLEEEWNFICDIVPNIIGGWKLAVQKICTVLCSLLNVTGERLLERIEELASEVPKEDDLNRKQILFGVCRELQSLFKEEREMSIKTLAFSKAVIKRGKGTVIESEILNDVKTSILTLKCTIPNAIERVQNICDVTSLENLDDLEKASFQSRCREILLQGYRFGFEFYKEMSDFVPKEGREKLARSMVQFAKLWMKFARERCERGRGKRPRWAYQGLEFLLTVCEPHNTKYLSETEFEELKNNMDMCISHVIGTTAPGTPDSGFMSGSPKLSVDLVRPFPRSRGSSPSPRPTYKSQRSNSRKASIDQSSPIGDQVESPVFNRKMESLHEGLIKIKLQPALRSERLLDAVLQLDAEIDKKLMEEELIGKVISKDPVGKSYFRRRQVTFSWQRGIKIGQGRFGKVYTAVNNNTGEMLAVKEIALQRNDAYTIRKVADELKILEGINHRNVIKYYGLEVHKEEMLIFMEFCQEGTLESLVAGTEDGLPEELIRQYTYQLVCGVAVLHEHGIVHRDIKTANIFLTEDGNCLKIGDFGCAVKIKSNFTMPGELQGFIGTQAYMAPEMFMTMSTEGHGRAADIWSVGCVVVEMSSGKRPWAEFDSNYQIMFKVGMGERPEAPESLIDEGHDFLHRCLQHNPKDRATATELLNHNFVKGGDSIPV